ncbi:MAG TPA: hypothetical protein VFM58_20400 [Solirubrobacteraceae bacterium]|nr:hypothetical protein [Solirubrobacteraceae bacterium]
MARTLTAPRARGPVRAAVQVFWLPEVFAPEALVPADLAAALVAAGFFAAAVARLDDFAPVDLAAFAAAFVLRDGFAAGGFVAPAGVRVGVFAVADLCPPGAPGFGAPTVDGEPDGRRAVPGVDPAAGVAGVVGAASRRSARKRLASPVPRVTASRPSSTAVSMMLFGLSAMRGVLPTPRGGYTARTGAGITAASPQAMASASEAEMFVRNVPSVSRSSPQARPSAGSEANPSSSAPPRGS